MAIFFLLNPKKLTIKNPNFSISLHLSTFFSSLCRNNSDFPLPTQSPPVPKKVPFNVTANGHTWNDSYHWMRYIKDPDFKKYLKLENSYADAFMEDTHELQRSLFTEMTSRIPAKISTAPERWGPWCYYQYIPEGKEYPVLCRKLGTRNEGWAKNVFNYVSGQYGTEQILLDWNEIAKQYGYVHVGTCRVSPDHNFLAYTLDITGNESFTLQIKDLKEESILPQSRVDGVVSLAWAKDSVNLFYTISDKNQRPYRVLCAKVGSDDKDDISILIEKDPGFCVDITSTKDGKFITVNSNSRNSSEVYIIDATNPESSMQMIHKRVPGVQFFLEHHHDFFYVLTNAPLAEDKLLCGGYYLATCRVDNIWLGKWQNIIFPGEGNSIQDMDIFDGHLVLFFDKKGSPVVCSINVPIDVKYKHHMEIDDLNPWYFPMPSNFCSIAPGSNHDFMNPFYRAVLSSPVMPDVIMDYDMSQKCFSIVQQEDARGIFKDASLRTSYSSTFKLIDGQNEDRHFHNMQKWNDLSEIYTCEVKEVISHDGVPVPLTILFSREAWKKDQSPGLLHGYGAYGESLDKSWNVDRLSLLDRGWVLAFADVRGGGGGGSSWHNAGSGMHKLNSIHDFVSCGEYLINKGYVDTARLAASGTSAGGLLVGAAINIYPTLFCSAVLKVPFLDILNTLLDPTLPLTILDFDEFGNPQLRSEFDYISSYSPYENIPRGVCHPSMLVTASFHDSRVGVWEAAKWVAKVREDTCSTCSRSVILKTNMDGGHFGEGGRFGQCEESAYEYAFLMKVMRASAIRNKSN